MSNWKIPLPKEKPVTGAANVGFAYKNSRGTRMEFTGTVTEEAAREVTTILIKHQTKNQLPSDTAHVEGDKQGGGKP